MKVNGREKQGLMRLHLKNKYMHHHHPLHELFNWILFSVASLTAVAGLHLPEIDLILAIVLKVVSIISFSLLIIINRKKIKESFTNQKTKNDEN